MSEHFSQFASINRGKIDIKKIIMFGRDTSRFNEESYRLDIANHVWTENSDDANIIAVDLITGLDEKLLKLLLSKDLTQKKLSADSTHG